MQPADVPVVILCGGLGMRLREETETRPKPMVEIGHAPMLWHIMKMYGHHGFRRFILCLGYQGHVIKEFFQRFEFWREDFTVDFRQESGVIRQRQHLRREPWEVTLAETGHDTMTGGRIRCIQPYIEGDLFMATYGDGLADVDLGAELSFHVAHGRTATLAAVNPRSRFGVLDVDADGVVTRFREKPLLDRWVNGGFYVFRRRVFDYLDPECVLEVEPLARLATDGELVAFRHTGQFYTMDTYRDFVALNQLWADGAAQWKVWRD